MSLDLAGPKSAASLRSRRSKLASPQEQLATLEAAPLPEGEEGDFDARLAAHGWQELTPAKLEILQINVGKLCNMTCRHCHVDAGPDRRDAMMSDEVMDACIAAFDASGAHTVDITGGAPELHPRFRELVEAAVLRGMHVIDRCNLTVLLLPKYRGLAQWLGDRGVEIVASLPHYRQRNTDAQRGDGAFRKSLEALRLLNDTGYGQGDPKRRLTLMSNPAGAFLAANQAALERDFKRSLEREHGVTFDRLIALNNMPISRYLEWLLDSDNLEAYMQRLVSRFNPAAVGGLMCRNTVSVGWDGKLYDCDFNQMLEMTAQDRQGNALSILDLDGEAFARRRIRTARHCFGCTAGSGSSCGGATA